MLANLRTAIAARGFRQWELAAELRLPASTLSEIVHGRRGADPSLRARLAGLLRADETWLFAGHVTIPPASAEHGEPTPTHAAAGAG